MSISLKNPLRYTAADHSVLCVCTSLLSPSRSITFVYSTIFLLGQHSDCQALSQVQRSHTHSLSLPYCQCDLSSPTQVYRMRIILSWYQNFCLFSFVLHTHTLTHSLPLTHPRLLLLLPINFCCSCFRRRSALTTRRRDVAACSRMCCVFCVCVCSLSLSLRLLRGCFVVVVVARVLLLYARSFAYKFQHYLKVVLCPFCCCVRSLSLSLCVFFLIRLLSPCLSPALRVLFCLILVAGWRLECGLMYRLKTNDVH